MWGGTGDDALFAHQDETEENLSLNQTPEEPFGIEYLNGNDGSDSLFGHANVSPDAIYSSYGILNGGDNDNSM